MDYNQSNPLGHRTHIKNKERIFGRHNLGRTVIGHLEGLFVPPFVTAFRPRDVVTRALEDQDVLDQRAFLECGVDDSLGGDSLSATFALVRGDEDTAFTVLRAITERFGGETGKDDRVNCTDTCAGKEGGDGLPGHGEVNGDGVALLDAEFFEDISDARYFAQELGVGDFSAFVGLVAFIDDGGLDDRVDKIRQALFGC